MQVRRAEKMEDFQKLIALGSLMHKEGHFRDLPYDVRRLEQLSRLAMEKPDEIAAFYVENDGEMVGMIAGYMAYYYFNAERFAGDYFTYVNPNKRGSIAAARLLSAFEKWAKSNGAREVIVGLRVDIDNERAAKFFKGLGYTSVAPILAKKVN